MSEQFQWIEPAEAAKHRHRHGASQRLHGQICSALLILLAGIFAALSLAPQLAFQVGLTLAVGLALSCALLFIAAVLLDMSQGTSTCTLDSKSASSRSSSLASRCSWSEAHSFEISDHATLPGIRTLSIHREGSSHPASFDFYAGQLDEAELSAFVSARIAEPTAQRLMRGVQM